MPGERDAYRRFHAGRHRMLLDVLAKHVPHQSKRLLDIGGGGDVGDLAETIAEHYAEEIHAVDLGDDPARAQRKGVLAQTCNIDRDPLPYPDGHFDIVLFASVIEHLYNPRHALDEMARVLAEDGLLIVEAPNAVALGRRLDALVGKNPFRSFNRYNTAPRKPIMEECAVFYTAEELEIALQGAFTIVERRYGMHTPPMNPLKAIARRAICSLFPRMADYFIVVAKRCNDAA